MKTILWFGFVLVGIAAGKVFFTKAGHKVTLECGISSFTKILEWSYKNGMIVSVDGKSGFHRKGTNEIGKKSRVKLETNLEISSVAEEDTGKFTCRADGVVQEHMLVVVLVSVSPSGVLQVGVETTLYCRVTNLNPEPTVTWVRPDGTSYTGSQTTQLKAVAGSDAGTWHCTFTYSGETFRESLNIKVEGPASATTPPHGFSSPKDSRNLTGIDHATDHQSNDAVLLLGLCWWVWLAVGVGCLIVIVLMVFVIVLCKRIRERNKKKKFEKSTQQPLKPKKYCQCDRQAAAAKPQQGRRREKPSALPLQPC